jgi:glucose/arabinose dehydrogenase
VKLIQHPTNADRWYVVEQRGKVFTLLASNPAGTRALAIDLEAILDLAQGGEQGLLGMAFRPGFAANGEVFFSYTESSATNADSVVARFASADGGLTFAPVAGNPDVIRFDAEQDNHNGDSRWPRRLPLLRDGRRRGQRRPGSRGRAEPEHAARQDPAPRRLAGALRDSA